MSRSNYADDCDDMWEHIRWRGAVKAAFHGARGQHLLRQMIAALDAMPVKGLYRNDFITPEGCCALGALAVHKDLYVGDLDPGDPKAIAKRFGIADAMVREIVFENDEVSIGQTPAQRWGRMRRFCERWLDPAYDEPMS